ncbi:MAG: glycosyltransferase family 39 protein [Candidatus Omnitrophica bacterium]|nr:glycosyltransferase family 39 protein [Candidatus Omnitrophota bacterium]
MFMAVLYFYHTLRFYLKERSALFLSYLFGLYPPFFRHMHQLLTETLSVLLICGIIYHICKIYNDDKKSQFHLLIASLYLGYLALTKIFFGYVILSGLLLFLFLFFLKRKNVFKKTLMVYALALLVCLPYLFYTYSLTGKIFYWGNSGGLSLYWMSTPYDNEFGDWFGFYDPEEYPKLFKNHVGFFGKLQNLSSIQRDEELKKQAIQNIINNPSKFFMNWLANIGRLVFSYPYTYSKQKLSTYFYIIPNMFIAVFSVLCFYLSCKAWRHIPYEIYALLLFGIISFLGSSLLSAYSRQFTPLVPVFILWISFIVIRFIRIEIT